MAKTSQGAGNGFEGFLGFGQKRGTKSRATVQPNSHVSHEKRILRMFPILVILLSGIKFRGATKQTLTVRASAHGNASAPNSFTGRIMHSHMNCWDHG